MILGIAAGIDELYVDFEFDLVADADVYEIVQTEGRALNAGACGEPDDVLEPPADVPRSSMEIDFERDRGRYSHKGQFTIEDKSVLVDGFGERSRAVDGLRKLFDIEPVGAQFVLELGQVHVEAGGIDEDFEA